MDISISAYVRYALEMMSDRTILSAIANIDFENQNVTIRSGYWKTFVLFVNSSNKATNIASTLKHLKILFIERFSACSANSIKDYFLGKLRRSYFDFRNILVYIDEHESNWLNRKKQFKMLRQKRFFERKAQRYYDYQKKQLVVDSDNNPTVVNPNITDIVNSDSESVNSDSSIPVDIPSNDDKIDDFYEVIDQTVVLKEDHFDFSSSDNVSSTQTTRYDRSSYAEAARSALQPSSSSNRTIVITGNETENQNVWPSGHVIHTATSVEQIGSDTMVTYSDGTTKMYHNGKWY